MVFVDFLLVHANLRLANHYYWLQRLVWLNTSLTRIFVELPRVIFQIAACEPCETA
jgi:hypothetical protein